MTPVRRMRPLLGTYVEISAVGEHADLEDAIAHAFDAIVQIQHLLSFHEVTSDLSKLNMAETGVYITLHPISIRVLRLANAITQASMGLFNCTVGGTLVAKGILPKHSPQVYLPSGNADDIQISKKQAKRNRPILITLDGIAKGYAVDCAIRTLKQYGCTAGLVNAGGDLRMFGNLSVPVYQRNINDEALFLGHLQNAAIATSCVRHTHDANFPAWIVAPDALPKEGVYSVIAHSAWRADALTKVACVATDAVRENILTKLGGRLVLPVENPTT
ncbi:MAG: FAD:protein FMN transferase [Methylotenera sp.]|nr:FAD:protein FMN transferase [Methylotenera sp.]